MTQASFRIREAILVEFREAVLDKHGKLHGAMREEAEAALEQHVRRMKEATDPS